MPARKERPIAATWITLVPDPSAAMVCSGCEGNCWQVHESGWRIIRDMPMFGDPVWLRVQLRRVRCSECGTRAERVLWLDRHARITRRLADFVGLWCEKLPVAHVCKLTGLHWETVRRIDRERLEGQLAALPEAYPTRLVLAKKLKAYWRGIVAKVRWPMHTGQLEGINNRINVMKRMAYGYRDSAFFFLKIKAAYPGNDSQIEQGQIFFSLRELQTDADCPGLFKLQRRFLTRKSPLFHGTAGFA